LRDFFYSMMRLLIGGLDHLKVILFKGIVKSEKELKLLTEALCAEPDGYGEREGIVVRIASEFKDDDFHTSCMKMVRANHVQTTDHWKHKEIIKNQLKYPSK